MLKLSAKGINNLQNEVYLSLGANIDPVKNLEKAINALSEITTCIAISSYWTGPPIGIDGPDFVNGAIHLQSPLSMHHFKRDVISRIESELGRIRVEEKFAPRSIDLDILIFNSIEVEIDIWRYAYLAAPLAEIHPDYENPRTGEIISDVSRQLRSQSEIYILKSSN